MDGEQFAAPEKYILNVTFIIVYDTTDQAYFFAAVL